MSAQVVLIEPEIPQNTGNIARTCACAGVPLHLVEPLGFRLTEKHLGRAAMDYWNNVDLHRWPCAAEFFEAHADCDFHLFTSHASKRYDQSSYQAETFLVFGRESRGIDPEILHAHQEECVRLPMAPDARSLNLSNAVAVALYEVLRESGFPGLA